MVSPEPVVSNNHKSFNESFGGRITLFLAIFSTQDSITFPLRVATALFPSIKISL
jgi:hypothetical protein